ncbi:hypothetical protein D5086_032511 [Populus alba]|uniref:Uncharacterized protein n=1 Tax=Populus alba TaxID=43335 RepID=A0ACC4AMB7_POPAL
MDVVGGVVDMINLLWIRFGRQINDVRKLRKKLQKLKADAEDLSNRKSGLTEELRNNVGKMASKLGKRVVQANFRVRELMRTKLLGYIGDGGVLSKHGSVCSAQKDMAGRLKVVLGSGESEERTSRTIFQYLHSKKSLLLLDDVWDDIDLDHVGIPNPKKQGKVSKVGDVANSKGICPYARDVVKECDGLLLAINVLRVVLRNTGNVYVWSNALRELQSPAFSTIGDMEDHVFKPLNNGDLEIISDMFFQYITGLGVLNLSNNGISLLPPSIGNLINLRGLYLNQCSELAMLPSDVEGKELEEDIFPNLEDLRLYDLPRLSNIVEGHVSPRSLANLNNCKNLEDFFEENATATEKVNYEHPSLKFFPLKCLPKIVSIDTIVELALSSIEEVYTIHCISVKSLPRSLVNAPRLMIITGQRKWWDEELQWEDFTIKQQLQPLFKACLDAEFISFRNIKDRNLGQTKIEICLCFLCLLFFCLLCLAAENEFVALYCSNPETNK